MLISQYFFGCEKAIFEFEYHLMLRFVVKLKKEGLTGIRHRLRRSNKAKNRIKRAEISVQAHSTKIQITGLEDIKIYIFRKIKNI